MAVDGGPDQPAVLREAHTIVAAQLRQLRGLAERTRREGEALANELRQAERQLDELILQHRWAIERRLSQAGALAARLAEFKARCEALAQELHTNQHAYKQLDQIIRQFEMSSDALTGAPEGGTADPWALALRAQVIHGREEERVRLAREVHDGPAQVLANSLMLIESCYTLAQQAGSERLVTMLARMREAHKEGLQDVRRFIADLRPGKLEELGLAAAVAQYIRGYTDAYRVQVTFDADPLPQLPIEAAIVLYRIVQESLQNAHKYARGAPVHVGLTYQGGVVRLTIRDEGPGFDPHEVARRAGRSSWGLTSMRERAELIGAHFTVTSRPGHGTDVLVTLPLG